MVAIRLEFLWELAIWWQSKVKERPGRTERLKRCGYAGEWAANTIVAQEEKELANFSMN